MSTNMQNVTTKTPDTAPSSGKTGSGMGLNLSSGMEAAVTAALSYLEQILCDINNKELQEYQGMATANQMASQYSAQNTIKAGEEMFIEALAQGLGSVVGSGISLGTMGIAELRDPNKAELAKVDQEVEGVQNYQKRFRKNSNLPLMKERKRQMQNLKYRVHRLKKKLLQLKQKWIMLTKFKEDLKSLRKKLNSLMTKERLL